MTARLLRALAVCALLPLFACGPKMIPGTNLRDTPDTRAILDVLRHYKEAFESKDAKGIVALASTRYLDTRDNISYGTLQNELQKDFDRVKQAQLDIQVRRIDVLDDRASVDFFYALNFLPATTDEVWKSESDDRRMVLVLEGGEWKVLSGF